MFSNLFNYLIYTLQLYIYMFFLLIFYLLFFIFCISKVIDLQQVRKSIAQREARLCEFLIAQQSENSTFRFLVSRFMIYILYYNGYKTKHPSLTTISYSLSLTYPSLNFILSEILLFYY